MPSFMNTLHIFQSMFDGTPMYKLLVDPFIMVALGEYILILLDCEAVPVHVFSGTVKVDVAPSGIVMWA